MQLKTGQADEYVVGQITLLIAHQILAFCETSRKASEIQELLELKHRETFQNNYLRPLLEAKLLFNDFLYYLSSISSYLYVD